MNKGFNRDGFGARELLFILRIAALVFVLYFTYQRWKEPIYWTPREQFLGISQTDVRTAVIILNGPENFPRWGH